MKKDIKNRLKLPLRFLTEYFGETLLHSQRMVDELWLIDPLLELAFGGVLELDVVFGFSRSES